MDKKERARIIAVKLEEVLHDINMEKYKELQAQKERILKDPELEKLLKQYDANRKALNTMADNLDEVAEMMTERLIKENAKDSIVFTINFHSGIDRYDHRIGEPSLSASMSKRHPNGYMESINEGEPTRLIISSTDVVTELTRHRNTDNQRLRKIVNEAFHLLLEDDADRMTKFLQL